ncbi:MAG: metal-dependent hydrolase [Candidatus Aenigmarchaeota archaeon]|nr:metal-dependent hydrolase [Candidatus Aenigmarchaeota archaeon]
MPYAVTHVILTIIILDLYRDYVARHKKYFTLWTIFIGGLAGLAPDMDIPVHFVLSKIGIDISLLVHGGISHTPIIGILFLIPFAAFWLMKKHRLAVIFLVISFGLLFHIFLDYLIGGGNIQGIMLFYPFSTETFKIFIAANDTDFPTRAGLDALILILWLFHEERKHKILDFI